MLSKGKRETYRFEGGENMDIVLAATAVSNQTSSYAQELRRLGVVRLTTSASHAFILGDGPKYPNHIYITGTANYNGLRKIVAVSAAQLDIEAAFVAETTSGSDTARPGLSFDEPWNWIGFKLHLDAASSTASENLIISIDAAAGSNFDINHVTLPMNGVQDYDKIWEEALPVNANDVLYVTWANASSANWGLELIAERLS